MNFCSPLCLVSWGRLHEESWLTQLTILGQLGSHRNFETRGNRYTKQATRLGRFVETAAAVCRAWLKTSREVSIVHGVSLT